jgi:hypothetical protein
MMMRARGEEVRKGIARTHAHPLVLLLLDEGIYGARDSNTDFWFVQESHRLTGGVLHLLLPPSVHWNITLKEFLGCVKP